MGGLGTQIKKPPTICVVRFTEATVFPQTRNTAISSINLVLGLLMKIPRDWNTTRGLISQVGFGLDPSQVHTTISSQKCAATCLQTRLSKYEEDLPLVMANMLVVASVRIT